MTMGQGQRMTDLEYSHTFIYSFSWLHQLTFRSQAAIVSEKSTVFAPLSAPGGYKIAEIGGAN